MIRRTVLCLAIAAGAASLSFRPIYEPDLWWHLAQGREDAAGRLVRTNVFSFTYPDYRQHYTPWLFDTIAYFAWRAAEGTGIQIFQAFWLVLTLSLLYAACRTRAPSWSAATLVILGFFILEPRAIPRPHLVSFAGMAACALLVARACERGSAGPLAWAIPLVALWSNFHVECVFGVLFIGLFSCAEFIRPSSLGRREAGAALAIAAGCAAATMANPYGWGLAAYLKENLSVPQILAIAELLPPYLPDYRAFFLYLIVAGVLLLMAPRSLRLWEASVAITFAAFGCMHLRLIPLVWLATATMLAARLPRLAARGIDRRAILITACCAALACARIPLRLFFSGFAAGTPAVAPRQFFSEEAIAFVVRAGLAGPVFNSHNLGGHLAWRLYPGVRIFQDSRLQAYPPEHFRRIIAASEDQREWDRRVGDVDWAVLSVPRPNQLSGNGRFPPEAWGSVYEDEAVEIVVRRSGKYGRVIQGN